MKTNPGRILTIAAMIAGLSGVAAAAGKDRPDIGKIEYMEKCAVCHGQSARGDGGVLDLLKKTPSDLTLLAKKNGGVFPADYVYRVVDGREVVSSHGDRDMPIWGRRYKSETVAAADHFIDVPYSMEMYTRARILSLIDYLSRIQAK